MTANTKLSLILIVILLNELQKEKAISKYYQGLREGSEVVNHHYNL